MQLGIFSQPGFQNAFWLFLGVVAGALIQHFLGFLSKHSQAENALKVLQSEITYNLREAQKFESELGQSTQRLSKGEISAVDVFFRMSGFDYSALSPLNSTGYLHILLGPDLMPSLLRFQGFFNDTHGQRLKELFHNEFNRGNGVKFLQDVEKHSRQLIEDIEKIQSSKKRWLRLELKQRQ
ncbi:hypothetical protein PVW46_01135 [Mameliella sp. AT18]|uniref:hypothetical protein n=1 Tax=Mameliella sp. AT18 TaxID=3028385 RepID=UPI001112FD1A|nr:hypothetical protein [Mameliella sp. AT18]MDD9728502.1 hypothetical protein [Mameliella sp. AT18]